MLDTQEITEFDLSLLPGWDEELKCESRHDPKQVPVCTVEVVAIKSRHCSKPFLICQASYEYNLRIISGARYYCSDCGENVYDCWKVTPV